jgi:hypothetical protein
MRIIIGTLLCSLVCGLASTQANYLIVRVIINQPGNATPNVNPMGPPGYPGGPMGIPGGPMGSPMGGPGGGPPPIGGGRPQGNTGTAATKVPTTSLHPNDYVMAVVEVKKMLKTVYVFGDNQRYPVIEHKYGGTTCIYSDGAEIIVTPYTGQKTPEQQLALKRLKLKRTVPELFALAKWAHGVGLIDRSIEILNELEKFIETDKSSGEVPADAAACLAVWKKLKPDLARGTLKQDNATDWKSRLGYTGMEVNQFYALIFNETGVNDLINRRLKMLDQTLKSFYIWHAFRGISIPLPEEKLVSVYIGNSSEYLQKQKLFTIQNPVGDGFLDRRDNVVIFAPSRTDEPYQSFQRKLAAARGNLSLDDVIKGTFPKALKTLDQKKDMARAQILQLTEMALQEESDLATCLHQGTRQLYAAIGWIPTTADAPEWLRFGSAAVFELPKGPFPGTFSQLKVGLWANPGQPSWAYTGYLDELRKARAFPNPGDLLRDVVTDTLFRKAAETVDEKPKANVITSQPTQGSPGAGYPGGSAYPGGSMSPGAPVGGGREEGGAGPPPIGGGGLAAPAGGGVYKDPSNTAAKPAKDPAPASFQAWGKARATAWGLAYYLMDQKNSQLKTYFASLNNLPRDLELDDEARFLLFAQAFDLVSAAPAGGVQIDTSKVNRFAEQWLQYLQGLRSPFIDLKLDDVEVGNSSGTNPMGNPGGSPGGSPAGDK